MDDFPIEITTSKPFNVPSHIEAPDIKGFGGRTRNLKRTLVQSCQKDAIIIAETAGDAIVDTMWMFITLDTGEVLEEYLDPRNARNSRKGKRGASGRRRRTRRALSLFWLPFKLLNLNGIVARLLPGKRIIRAFAFIPGVGIFFRIFNVVELGLFGWLIFEAADNFVTKWMSGLQQAQWCTSTVPGLFVFQRKFEVVQIHGAGDIDYWLNTTDINPDVNEGWNVQTFGEIAKSDSVPEGNLQATFALVGGSYSEKGPLISLQIGVRMVVRRTSGQEDVYTEMGNLVAASDSEAGALEPVRIEVTGKDIEAVTFIMRQNVSGNSGTVRLDLDWVAAVLPKG